MDNSQQLVWQLGDATLFKMVPSLRTTRQLHRRWRDEQQPNLSHPHLRQTGLYTGLLKRENDGSYAGKNR